MEEVLKALVHASERAANIARSCCSDNTNETLLVAEKGESEANARFDKDFKTIADVLAQESARHEVASRLPMLAEHFRGEECAELNGVAIKLQEDNQKTAELLCSLVPESAALRMAEAAHSEISMAVEVPADLPNLQPADLGVWIDPIDATAEFIAGVRGEVDNEEKGLPCVTVLIGAYSRTSGEPVIGVINQPFYDKGKGRIFWGISYNGTQMCSQYKIENTGNKIILMSGAEDPVLHKKFGDNGWEVKSVPGAGNKLMKVAIGEAAAYIVSKGTTFRWDTCAPHAILRAKGGDILSYATFKPLTYNDPMNIDTQLYANAEGIIAFTDSKVLEEIKSILN